MSLRTKRILAAVQAVLAIVAVLNFGACSRSQHVTESLTGLSRESVDAFGKGQAKHAAKLVTVSLSPSSVLGGNSSAGTVALNGAAPAGGARVTLSSNNSSKASVPSSVTIPEGARNAAFTVSTSATDVNVNVVITGSFDGNTRTATLVVTAPAPPPAAAALASVSLNPGTVAGGASSQGTVALTANAPAGGAVVSLSSSNSGLASTPASVTVAEGSNSATFAVTTTVPAADGSATITASMDGVTRTATLNVNAPAPPPAAAALNSVSLNPGTVAGGASSQGRVTLTSNAPAGGAVVSLSSSNSGLASTPASVTVLEGANSALFAVTTTVPAANASATITASMNGVTRTATLNVTAPPPPPPAAVLNSVSLNPGTVAGGASSQGTVTLSANAPAGGTSVSLSSSNSGLASVASSVTVAAGANSATFAVTTTVPVANGSATITGSLNGVSRSATLNVTAPALASLSLEPASVTGGTSSVGTVTLTAGAPAGGATVALSSGNGALASVPGSVTVPSGATSATFNITTTPSAAGGSALITGNYQGVARSATLTVGAPDPCVSLTGLGGAVIPVLAEVPQFRTGRLRIEIQGDVAAGWMNALGICTASDAASVSFVSGTGNVTLSGSNTSVTGTGAPLTFGPLAFLGAAVEPGIVVNDDPAGNVLEIIWPALVGDPPAPPILRLQLTSWSAAVQTGRLLDCTMTFNARHANGTTATFTARGTGMVVPAFRP